MDKVQILELELNEIYNRLFDAADPLNTLVLSNEDNQYYKSETVKLEKQIEKIYKKMLKELEKENPEILEHEEVKKLYDKSSKVNYFIFRFLIEHQNICSSKDTIQEIEKFIYDCKYSEDMHRTYYRDIQKKLSVLNSLQPIFFQYIIFVRFLNDYRFPYLKSYFTNKVIMENDAFVDYLLNKIDFCDQNIKFGEYHHVIPSMEMALKEKVDANLIYAMGNKECYENYLKTHDIEYIFHIINSIENEEVKIKLLVDIFHIKVQNKAKLHVLSEFLIYPEIQKQLLNETSFYYNVLIKPLISEHSNESKTLGEYEVFEVTEGYASIRDVVEYHSDDFYDYQFDKIIHHFDKYVQNYIYFYYENEVKKIPVLYYIQTMQRKIELWERLHIFPCIVKINEEIEKEYYNEFDEYVNKDFVEMAIASLEENIGRCLSSHEEDYWNYLLKEASVFEEGNILLERKI